MEIKPIKTEQDYNVSIKRIEELWGAKKDTAEGDELDLLYIFKSGFSNLENFYYF